MSDCETVFGRNTALFIACHLCECSVSVYTLECYGLMQCGRIAGIWAGNARNAATAGSLSFEVRNRGKVTWVCP